MLGVAVEEFAVAGLAGASTVRIATLAGISQAYLFRLFGSKRALFLATYDIVSIRILDSMDEATEGLMGTAGNSGISRVLSRISSRQGSFAVHLADLCRFNIR